ncbi:hypothetical protein HET69_13120 [Streptomyces sp. CJ_13]|uniref:hypothetical protein n=1 Tax=Streptomyces sp. CJ_13 TaxID=2724943 RepID=UPI001BDD2FF7|nr:hypothetical protein [Streptomyces sp. CJ_13]MBT1184941.1 hypothetical protein [Streptomyces sp. CJ_13]
MALTRETVVRNLWASSALFVTAAFIAFVVVRSDAAVRVGWTLYFMGWLPPLTALAICVVRKDRPGAGGAVALAVLAVFGFLFWLNHA